MQEGQIVVRILLPSELSHTHSTLYSFPKSRRIVTLSGRSFLQHHRSTTHRMSAEHR